MLWHQNGQRESRAFSASDLKICDLCGALNLASNQECFVCRWHGSFERRADVVNMAMELVERQHGRLDKGLFSGAPFVIEKPPRGPLALLSNAFRRIKAWLTAKLC